MTNLYVDVNILQSVPSSNINRDDIGAPKTGYYGGVIRARVSSQSWKKAVRDAFRGEETGKLDSLKGIRTLKAPRLLAQELIKLEADMTDNVAMEKSIEIFKKLKIKLDKKTNQTKALLMVSQGEIEKIAEYVVKNKELDLKKIKDVLKSHYSLDLALFGRMVADDPELNVDASSQVAHALSTHEVVPEYDYYTAVDDELGTSESGAAMIGTIEYDSATLYRYANVNVNELIRNLGNTKAALWGLKLFIKYFVLSMPTGKQNTFANKTIPQYVMVTVRTDTPVNLVSAFEEPVQAKNGYINTSIERLEKEYSRVQAFVNPPLSTKVLSYHKSNLVNNQVANLTELLNDIEASVEGRVNDENIAH